MRNLTKITIKNLKVNTIIGILPEERKTSQPVIITLTIEFDDGRAAVSDKIEDTIDYAGLEQNIYHQVSESSFNLLEALSEFILDIATEDKRVKKAAVSIEKPKALMHSETVIIEKSRDIQY